MSSHSRHALRLLPAPYTGALAQNHEFTSSAPQQLANLLADSSSSMAGPNIQAVNRSLRYFVDDCSQDVLTRRALQIQLVTFGARVQAHPFVSLTGFVPPTLVAGGLTPLAEALMAAIAGTERHRQMLIKAAEVDVRKPHYFLFSDGRPTSPEPLLKEVAACIRRIEETRQGAFYAFGVDQSAVDALQPLFPRRVHLLPEGPGGFAAFFHILSVSCRSVSARSVNEDFDLTPLIESQLQNRDSEDDDA